LKPLACPDSATRKVCLDVSGGGNGSRSRTGWIAVATIDCGGTLLTFDRDFERIPGMDKMTLAAHEG